MGSNNSTPQQAQQPSMQFSNQTSNGQPPMSYANGTTNALPSQPPMSPQQDPQMASFIASLSQGQGAPLQADTNTNQMIANIQKMKESGVFNTPEQNFSQQHPVRDRIAKTFSAMGQSLSGQPTYTGNQNNQAALQGKQMDNMATMTSPTSMMNAMFMKQVQDAAKPPQSNGSSLPRVMHSPQQIAAYNSARSSGMSPQEAGKLAGF